MIIAFTGTRHGMTPGQLARLSGILSHCLANDPEIKWIMHGGCIGADEQLHRMLAFAGEMGRTYVWPSNLPKFRAQLISQGWTTGPILPPLERNRVMVNLADLLIATPAEAKERLRSGTWSTVRYARKRNVSTELILP